MNNSITFELFESRAVLFSSDRNAFGNNPFDAAEDDGGFDDYFSKHYGGGSPDNAPLMYSPAQDIAVVSFRSGSVQKRDTVLDRAAAYAEALEDALRAFEPMPKAIVVAGHSEGGALAEAVVHACLAIPQIDKSRLFLVATGAHLWATPEECDEIVRAMDGRFMSLVHCGNGGIDPYAVETSGDDRREVRHRLVSLPKTYLVDGGAVTGDSIAATEREFIIASGIATVATGEAGEGLHQWKGYEKAIRAAFPTSAVTRGGGAGATAAAWLGALTVVATSAVLGSIA